MVKRPRQGDIIYVNFDPSAGAEIRKRRPAIVISNDELANTSPFVWVVPISHGSFDGKDYPLHTSLDERTSINGVVYVEQIKALDYKKRKWSFVEKLPQDLLVEIKNKTKLVVL